MKIAYIVPYVPNLIRTRPYNLILSLTDLGHEVDVFTLGSAEVDVLDARTLEKKCHKVYYQNQPVWRSLVNSVLAVPTSRPLQSVYSWNSTLAAQLLEQLVKNESSPAYDIIHVEHLRGSRYGLFIKSKLPALPVVWDSVDCISNLFKQAASQGSSRFSKLVTWFELGRTRKAEGNLLTCFDHVLITSESDKNALLTTLPTGMSSAPVSILPNGVDHNYFRPNPDLLRDPKTLIFSGKMSYHANISMVVYLVKEIMPRLWAKDPEVHLVVVGKDPPPEVRKMSDSQRIQVTGTVDDIRPYLWKATAAVVPLVYGAGIQNKILEAMATETPVITNSKVLGSLSVVPGRDLLIADNADDFAACALKLMEDAQLRKTIGQAGNAYVKKHHNWNKNAERMIDVYSQLKRSDLS